jgi:uncharacterized protein YegL
MCKQGYINVVFVIDESGSMSGSESDIIGGFNKTIEEQKAITDGKCTVSFFSFNDKVTERFIGKDVNEVKPLEQGSILGTKFYSHSSYMNITTSVVNGVADIAVESDIKISDPLYQYAPGGCTAMNDGIGTAIDKIGKCLSDMPEEERPSKNLIVIITDGEENMSKEYTLKQVQEMIKHQTEKYDWSFVYMGMDITNAKTAEDLGISTRSFSSKSSDRVYKNYSNISNAVNCYRCCDDVVVASSMMNSYLNAELDADTKLYEEETGIKIENN